MKTQVKWMIAIGALCASGMVVRAQAPEPPDVFIHKEVKVAPGPGGPDVMFYHQEAGPGPFTVDFIGAEAMFSGKPVKGAPYTADSVTETTQTLGDGNHITRKTTSTIYRDSEGRTRREESMGAIGPWAAAGDSPQTVFIHDPVAEASYVLNPRTHTAHKLPMGKMGAEMMVKAGARGQMTAFRREGTFTQSVPPPAGPGKAVQVTVEGMSEAAGAKMMKPEVKTEALGKQMIEGVEAEGSRSTITLPAGAIGNERPLESVTERWYSPALQTVVMSKRSDPRFGETSYRLINIRQGEQPPALFEVPSDYNVTDDASFDKMMKVRKRADEAK